MHNSDNDVPGEANAAAGLLEQPNLVHLFAQNCDRAHAKITCVPIGLENRWLGAQIPSHHKGYHGAFPELMFGFVSSLVPMHPASAVAAKWTPEPTGSAETDHMLWAMFDRATDGLTAKPVRTELHAMMRARSVRDPEAARHVPVASLLLALLFTAACHLVPTVNKDVWFVCEVLSLDYTNIY